MSSSLAVAAVSAVLRSVLETRFASDPVASTIGAVGVSVLPPDRVDVTEAADPNQVNLFLHQVTRNPGWSNSDLPSRDGAGRRVTAPPLVLDLHYLVSVYGSTPFYAEILLGELMQEFHARPVLARDVIERALAPAAPPAGFPAQLAQSGIAFQLERLRVSPENVAVDDVSRLWSALQARYRTTVAYQVTTVIIEDPEGGRPALPVGRPLGSAVTGRRPEILRVRAAGGQMDPVLPGTNLVVEGRNLSAPGYAVELDGVEVTDLVTSAEEESLVLSLPSPLPAGLYPGMIGVRVLHRHPLGDPPSPHAAAESNLATLTLRPRVTVTAAITATENSNGVVYRSGTLTLTSTTPLGGTQRVEALLNERDAAADGGRAYRLRAPEGNGIVAPATQSLTVAIPFTRVAAGSYLVRARVDGAESVLAVDAATGRFSQPEVTL